MVRLHVHSTVYEVVLRVYHGSNINFIFSLRPYQDIPPQYRQYSMK